MRPPAFVVALALCSLAPAAALAEEVHAAPSKPTPRAGTLAVEGDLGIAGRLGDADSGYDVAARQGMLFGGGLFYAPARQYDLGLTYQNLSLGHESYAPGATVGTVEVDRTMNTLFLHLRTYPWWNDKMGLFVGLMVGPSWEHSVATGIIQPVSLAAPGRPAKCTGSSGLSATVGATVGMDFDLGDGLGFLTRLSGTSYQGLSDLIESDGSPCFPASGSVATIDGRVAFQYRFGI